MSPRILGVLGGNDVDDDRLVRWASSADSVYAADSGADRLIALGFSPIVVGDFDSFAALPEARHLRLVQSIDQHTTDCDKLLRLVEDDGHGALTMTGTEGDLPDHVLATFSSVVASRLDVRIAFRRGMGHIVRPNRTVSLAQRPSTRVSLLPLTACQGVVLQGVAWPLQGASIEPGGALSVSNESAQTTVTASVEQGTAMLFVETDAVEW